MNILLIISLLLLSGYILLMMYYAVGWHRLPVFSGDKSACSMPYPLTISIIIPARNEEKNLPALLDSIQHQSYPAHLFEVIVADDFSTDATVSICRRYSFVQCISLKDFVTGNINSYKKKAIELAIRQSKGELIVTTDADCIVPPGWLQTIASFYASHQSQLIVMPVAIKDATGPVETFQALDFMSLQGITAASVYKKLHSMCNGANLAYTRKAFDAVNGFEGIDAIASGDDMLLMHKIARQYPGGIQYLKSKNVIVQTEAVHSVAAFMNQRIRWASKADKYEDKRIFLVLLLVYFLNLLLVLLPLLSLVNGQLVLMRYWLLLLVAKTFFECLFLIPVASFFGQQRLLRLFPLAQPFHILYTVVAGFLGKFGAYKWKGRKVK